MSWGVLIEPLLAAGLIRLGALVFVAGLLIGVALMIVRRRSKT